MKALDEEFAVASDRPAWCSRWAGAVLRLRSGSLLLIEFCLWTGEGFWLQNVDLLEAVCSLMHVGGPTSDCAGWLPTKPRAVG